MDISFKKDYIDQKLVYSYDLNGNKYVSYKVILENNYNTSEYFLNSSGYLDREGKPAFIYRDKNKKILFLSYCRNGYSYRNDENKPALIDYENKVAEYYKLTKCKNFSYLDQKVTLLKDNNTLFEFFNEKGKPYNKYGLSFYVKNQENKITKTKYINKLKLIFKL